MSPCTRRWLRDRVRPGSRGWASGTLELGRIAAEMASLEYDHVRLDDGARIWAAALVGMDFAAAGVRDRSHAQSNFIFATAGMAAAGSSSWGSISFAALAIFRCASIVARQTLTYVASSFVEISTVPGYA